MKPSTYIVAGTGLVLLCTTLSFGAGKDGVLVLRSSDLAPYQAVEQSFSAGVGQPVKSLSLTQGAEAARAALSASSLVLALGPDAAKLVAEAKTSVHALYALVPHPEKLGGAESSRAVPMFVAADRQVRVIRELLPTARRLGVVFDPAVSAPLVDQYDRAARNHGLSLVRQEVRDKTAVTGAVRELLPKVDALWLLPDATTLGVDVFKFLMQASLEAKVPLIGFSQGMAKAGALVSLEAEYAEMGREAANVARRVLSGSPSSPEAPMGALYLNSKAAALLGVNLSSSLKSQAKAVY